MTPPTGQFSKEVLDAYERFCPAILCDLMHEVVRAEQLHNKLPIDPLRVNNILGEEYGEVCAAALDYTRDYLTTPIEERRQHMRDELIQLASAAMRAVENIDKGLV